MGDARQQVALRRGSRGRSRRMTAEAHVSADDVAGTLGDSDEPLRLEVRGCWKEFPGVQALRDVSTDVRRGEIHALLGENGAGKSTLGKVIGGVYQSDAGEVLLDGNVLGRIDEHTAARLGIAIVHQEGSLVPQLSVAENVFAGHAPKLSFGRVDRKESARRTRALMMDLGVDIAPEAPVYSLSTAQAQVVEIAKGLSHELRLLILDEPTASLTLAETARLFEILRRLRDSGVSIIYISHRLAEIFQLCDRVTVLKDGAVTGTRDVAPRRRTSSSGSWSGATCSSSAARPCEPGDVVLEVEHLASSAGGRGRLLPGPRRRAGLPLRAGGLGSIRVLPGHLRRAPPKRRRRPPGRQGGRLRRTLGRHRGRHRDDAGGPQGGRPLPGTLGGPEHRRDGVGQGLPERGLVTPGHGGSWPSDTSAI